MSDYKVVHSEEATDYMADYPGFGEMRSFTDASGAEQVAFTWRRMPPGTGGRGSYGHRHKTQEEVYFVTSGTVTFKVGDEVFEVEPKHVVRISPDALRSIHNDSDEDAEIVICSVKADDPREDTEMEEGFWPEEE